VKKKKSTGFSVLIGFMKGNIINYAFAIGAAVVFAVLNLLPPYIVGGTIDVLIGKGKHSSEIMRWIFEFLGDTDYLVRNLYIIGAFLIMVNISAGLFSFVKVVFSNKSSEKIAKRIRDDIFEHLQNLPFAYHSKADKGDIIQRCTSDIETVRSFLSSQFVEVTGSILSISFVFVSMLTLDLELTLISVIFIPFIFFFSYIFFKRIRKAYKNVEEAEGRMSNVVQENVNGVRVVKAFGQEYNELQKFNESNDTLFEKTLSFIKVISLFWAVADLSSLLQIGILILAGVVFAVTGQVTVGMLTIFITYEWMILWPVKQVARILGDFGKTMVSVDRIKEILDEDRESDGSNEACPELRGDIVFSNISFGYPGNDLILKNISFEVKSGETLGIIGPTGSGKSTLIHLLQRLFDHTEGTISIGGIDIKRINRKWLRKNIGIVLQEPFLYSKTIRDNIALAYMDASIETVHMAAKTAAVHDVINEFDEGYQTLVGEKGVTLSGGQKQRVAIARTIIREKPILIFDDSLSAVDTETDAIIRTELKKNVNKATKIIISHRINTLKDADKIIVIEDGFITQMGDHKELLAKEGLYKRIYDVQNMLYLDIQKEDAI